MLPVEQTVELPFSLVRIKFFKIVENYTNLFAISRFNPFDLEYKI